MAVIVVMMMSFCDICSCRVSAGIKAASTGVKKIYSSKVFFDVKIGGEKV